MTDTTGTCWRRRWPRTGALAATIAVAAALAVTGRAHAQGDGELQDPRFDAADEEVEVGWRGNADFGFTLTEGNSQTTSLSLGARAVHRGPRSRWTADGNLVRTTTDGEEVANRGDLSAQYDWFPTARVYLFTRGAASYNEPAGLDLRLSPAAGLGYQLLERERTGLSVEGGGSWIRDEFADGSSSEGTYLVASESFYLRLAEDTDVTQSLTWRPNTGDFGDFLLGAEVTLSTMITEALGLQVSFRDQFDSEPFVDPETGQQRRENDLTFVTGVTFRF